MKRIKVTYEPKKIEGIELLVKVNPALLEPLKERVVLSMLVDGGMARESDLPIDHISCTLLRSADMQASWRIGWRVKDAELKARAGAKSSRK